MKPRRVLAGLGQCIAQFAGCEMKNDDDGYYRTVLGSGLGLWLVSDRPRSYEWESFARRITTVPRYRQRPLVPWQGATNGIHIGRQPESIHDGEES
jgi:hypothetical protein